MSNQADMRALIKRLRKKSDVHCDLANKHVKYGQMMMMFRVHVHIASGYSEAVKILEKELKETTK